MSKLAIIIPAYKDTYLDKAINSIANQTCKDFNLYIGDDCSPYPIHEIVDAWSDRIEINYTRFNENYGGKDLIKQWERCINLVNEEEWIWLFSDDDIMDAECVEKFYESVNDETNVDLIHFDTTVIDQNDDPWRKPTCYPKRLSCADYIDLTYRWKDRTNAVCFIFRLEKFKEVDGFEHFDLAWGSDHATWTKLAKDKGIKSIKGPMVYWRYGDDSISSQWDKEIIYRKKNAFIEFLEWRANFIESNKINIATPNFWKAIFIIRTIRSYATLSFQEKNDFLKRGLQAVNSNSYYPLMFFIQWTIFSLYTRVYKIFKKYNSQIKV